MVCVDGSGAFSLCSELQTFISGLTLDSLEIPIISASLLNNSLLTAVLRRQLFLGLDSQPDISRPALYLTALPSSQSTTC